MEASVRLYGMPRSLRTENRISEVIQNIGHASDWHRLNPRNFYYDPSYVPVRVKLDVTKALFSSSRNPKSFQDSLSHRILRHIHEALNINENKN